MGGEISSLGHGCPKLGWNQPPMAMCADCVMVFLPPVMQRQLNGVTEAATKLFTMKWLQTAK